MSSEASSNFGCRVPSVYSTLGHRIDQLNLNNIDQLSENSTKQLNFTPRQHMDGFSPFHEAQELITQPEVELLKLFDAVV